MSRKDRFILNRKAGEDVIHRNPIESCNTDQAERRQNVDAKTAAALIASGAARPCSHCMDPAT